MADCKLRTLGEPGNCQMHRPEAGTDKHEYERFRLPWNATKPATGREDRPPLA
jgi:hypothetical protein